MLLLFLVIFLLVFIRFGGKKVKGEYWHLRKIVLRLYHSFMIMIDVGCTNMILMSHLHHLPLSPSLSSDGICVPEVLFYYPDFSTS